jgi:outer membrane autotransporter protein
VGKDVKVTPEVRGRWAHEFSDEDYLVNARFEGSTTGSFRVEGDKPDRDSGLLGLGFTAAIAKNFNISADYDADVSGDRTVQALRAGVAFTW